MASIARVPGRTGNRLKYGFLAVLLVAFLAVVWVDDRFWFDPLDPHARRIAAFWTLLVCHGLTGLAALATGTLQMSRRIRQQRPRLHRQLGYAYLAAVCLSAPLAIFVGVSRLEPATIRVEQAFQGGLWLVSALVALAAARLRLTGLHRDWMIRSYGFTLVFVTSRVPDVIWSHYSDQFLSDMLWALILAALIAPDAINTATALRRVAR